VNSTPNDKEREMLASASGYTYKQVRQHARMLFMPLETRFTYLTPVVLLQVTTWVSRHHAIFLE
jgi:hypothetical protein